MSEAKNIYSSQEQKPSHLPSQKALISPSLMTALKLQLHLHFKNIFQAGICCSILYIWLYQEGNMDITLWHGPKLVTSC